MVLTNTVDWTLMEQQVEKVRRKKLKNAAGRPPHLRATVGGSALHEDAHEHGREHTP